MTWPDASRAPGPRAERPSREATRRAIEDNAHVGLPYLILNALAALVASYGLLANSIAVFGALIIAALLGPIAGVALALVDGDNRLLARAFLASLARILIVLGVSLLVGRVHRDLPVTTEMVNRTSANILDLIIALAGGAAAAYAVITRKVSAATVDVAIAAALVPPLATGGLLLARGETSLAFGALLLFTANLMAIQFACSLVMLLHGFHLITARQNSGWRAVMRNGVSFLLLAALAGVLMVSFREGLEQRRYEETTRNLLKQVLEANPGVQLVEVRFREEGDGILAVAVVRTPYSFAPDGVASLESELPFYQGRRTILHVWSIITKETSRDGYLHEQEDAAEDLKGVRGTIPLGNFP